MWSELQAWIFGLLQGFPFLDFARIKIKKPSVVGVGHQDCLAFSSSTGFTLFKRKGHSNYYSMGVSAIVQSLVVSLAI